MLLRLRRRQEELARRGFDRAAAEVDGLRRRVGELDAMLAARSEAVRKRLTGPTPAAPPPDYAQHVEDLRLAIDEDRARMPDAEEALAGCRAELAEAVRRRKAAELLVQRVGEAPPGAAADEADWLARRAADRTPS